MFLCTRELGKAKGLKTRFSDSDLTVQFYMIYVLTSDCLKIKVNIDTKKSVNSVYIQCKTIILFYSGWHQLNTVTNEEKTQIMGTKTQSVN